MKAKARISKVNRQLKVSKVDKIYLKKVKEPFKMEIPAIQVLLSWAIRL